MPFINPVTDYAFNKIFASYGNEDILMNFLNAFIYKGENVIQSLDVIEPYHLGKFADVKVIPHYFNTKVQLNTGKDLLIGIQIYNTPTGAEQIMYHAAKAYAEQREMFIPHREPRLLDSFSLAITDFVFLQQGENPLSHFQLVEETEGFLHPDQSWQLFVVQLPLFNKKLEELETLADRWLYFLRNAPILTEIPESLKLVESIEKAFNIADQANWKPADLADLAERELLIQQQIVTAK